MTPPKGNLSGDGDGRGAASPRPVRRQARALKPGSPAASPPPSVEVGKPGGRRARILASNEAMRRNDELKAKRQAEADG